MKTLFSKMLVFTFLFLINVTAFAQQSPVDPDGGDDAPIDSSLIWLAGAGALFMALYFLKVKRITK